MKFLIITFVLLILFLSENLALDAENYTNYIEELSRDEKFLEEYTKWSLELFSQSDYLYGDSHAQFPCSINKSNSTPTSVHTLRPSDVKCIAAMGDGLTAGLAAHAVTPMDLLFENRGISWSVGGDYTYSKMISIPNALRQFNPKLEGFSTKVSMMSLNGRNPSNNRLNVAKSGDHSIHLPYQAELLINRIKNENICDWKNDWKIITLFVGGNDLCSFCEDSNMTHYTPEQYRTHIRDALDKLYHAPIPRTLVNLVLTLDVRSTKDLGNSGYICQTLLKRSCPCAAFPTVEQAKILDDYFSQYHQVLLDLVESKRYEDRDDFTVVIQPFMVETKLPMKDNHKIDFSYFAPDCFHFSGKGHSQAALSLWNNMLEPVGGKQWSWHIGESLKCPTNEYPYIFTSKNSAKALDELKRTTSSTSTISSSTFIFDVNTTVQHHHKRRKDSDSSFSKIKLIVIVGFISIIVLILIVGIVRRRRAHVFILKTGRERFDVINNSQYPDENDEEEVWNRWNTKSNQLNTNEPTKTHGTRISFE